MKYITFKISYYSSPPILSIHFFSTWILIISFNRSNVFQMKNMEIISGEKNWNHLRANHLILFIYLFKANLIHKGIKQTIECLNRKWLYNCALTYLALSSLNLFWYTFFPCTQNKTLFTVRLWSDRPKIILNKTKKLGLESPVCHLISLIRRNFLKKQFIEKKKKK